MPKTKKLPKEIAAEKGMVNVQIDGKWVQVPQGARIIDVCKSAGSDIPHYCYHESLSSPGNCRMCMVQIGMPPRLAPGKKPVYEKNGYQKLSWNPKPIISCANRVAENMGIRTQGEIVEKSREGVMEFLLINHPLDCPICDQAGECKLQDFSVAHGKGTSRFKEDKIKKPKNVKIGPRVRLDDERCILCSRCVRFMDEIVREPVLGIMDRGTHSTVGVFPGKELTSNYSLNTVDICPVGALTSNDFRFKMRTWFLKQTDSIDTNCGTGCNITIWTRSNKIYRITPRRNDEVNSFWMPDSHRLTYSCPSDEDRLTIPMIKFAGKHQPCRWTDAIATATKELKKYKPGQIAIIASGRQTNEEIFLMRTMAAELGIQSLAIVPRMKEADGMLISADRNPNTLGAKVVLQDEDPEGTLEAFREGIHEGEIRAVIVASEDLLEDARFTKKDLQALDLLISIQTKENATAELSDIVFPGAASTEKDGTMINVSGRLQKLRAACSPPGEARDDWEILCDLILALNYELSESAPKKIDDVFSEIATFINEFDELEFTKLSDQGLIIKETNIYTLPIQCKRVC